MTFIIHYADKRYGIFACGRKFRHFANYVDQSSTSPYGNVTCRQCIKQYNKFVRTLEPNPVWERAAAKYAVVQRQ